MASPRELTARPPVASAAGCGVQAVDRRLACPCDDSYCIHRMSLRNALANVLDRGCERADVPVLRITRITAFPGPNPVRNMNPQTRLRDLRARLPGRCIRSAASMPPVRDEIAATGMGMTPAPAAFCMHSIKPDNATQDAL